MIAVDRTRTGAGLTARPATPADRNALMRMYSTFEPKAAALGLPPVDPQRCGEWLDTLGAVPNFIAEDTGRIVGHSVLFPDADGKSAEVAVFVHQDWRGCGIGKLLLSALVEQARALRLQRIWGICEQDNVPMLRLAHSCGFTETWSGEFYLNFTRTPASAPSTL